MVQRKKKQGQSPNLNGNVMGRQHRKRKKNPGPPKEEEEEEEDKKCVSLFLIFFPGYCCCCSWWLVNITVLTLFPSVPLFKSRQRMTSERETRIKGLSSSNKRFFLTVSKWERDQTHKRLITTHFRPSFLLRSPSSLGMMLTCQMWAPHHFISQRLFFPSSSSFFFSRCKEQTGQFHDQ